MKTPHILFNEQLAVVIKHLFNISIKNLQFLPVGESSWLYVAILDSGEKVVVKIQSEINVSSEAVKNYLAKNSFSWTPKILLSVHGKVWEKQDNYYYSVQEFVQAKDLKGANDKPDSEYLFQLGQLLSNLHTLHLDNELSQVIPIETFTSSFFASAQEAIDMMVNQPASNAVVNQVKEVLAKQKDKIKLIMVNSQKYGELLSKNNNDLVLTHGDVHFGNILEPKDDHIYLVDWDWAMLALPEYDFMYFDDSQLKELSKGYGRDLLANKTALQYYRTHLILRAFWFWINKALNSKTDDESEKTWKTFIEIIDDSPYFLRAFE